MPRAGARGRAHARRRRYARAKASRADWPRPVVTCPRSSCRVARTPLGSIPTLDPIPHVKCLRGDPRSHAVDVGTSGNRGTRGRICTLHTACHANTRSARGISRGSSQSVAHGICVIAESMQESWFQAFSMTSLSGCFYVPSSYSGGSGMANRLH